VGTSGKDMCWMLPSSHSIHKHPWYADAMTILGCISMTWSIIELDMDHMMSMGGSYRS